MLATLSLLLLLAIPAQAQERQIVTASEPEALAVTVYRDPNRGMWEDLDPDWPQGFAMISETRTVTLPPGRSTIRFDGVSEGMIAVSAIVTGLPGGTIEKNRNADLLSPAALVNGTLGNRITITRTNPATGAEESETAIVRTRADGGLVLQSSAGYEAVRCSGLPERLTFDAIPDGLSAQPVFTIDTASDTGGTYQVTLTYLSWGFDWQADYVATVQEGRAADDIRFDLTSWLTILNDNGQSFENAELMAVAGTLNIVSGFAALSDPPDAAPLRLSCWPIGSTARGSPLRVTPPPPPPLSSNRIVVTGLRVSRLENAAPIVALSADDLGASSADLLQRLASEEQLGDLKLYRVPVPTDVNAQGLKQVAFLREEDVEGEIVYEVSCHPYADEDFYPALMTLETENDEEHGLGAAIPSGTIAVFDETPLGNFLIAEERLRDYANGQEIEVNLGESTQVFGNCAARERREGRYAMQLELTNANPEDVNVRVEMGAGSAWRISGKRTQLRNGQRIVTVRVPGNGSHTVDWTAIEALQ